MCLHSQSSGADMSSFREPCSPEVLQSWTTASALRHFTSMQFETRVMSTKSPMMLCYSFYGFRASFPT